MWMKSVKRHPSASTDVESFLTKVMTKKQGRPKEKVLRQKEAERQSSSCERFEKLTQTCSATIIIIVSMGDKNATRRFSRPLNNK